MEPSAQTRHAGLRRETPKFDKTVTRSLERCIDCPDNESRFNSNWSRIIEDIQPDSKLSVTEYVFIR